LLWIDLAVSALGRRSRDKVPTFERDVTTSNTDRKRRRGKKKRFGSVAKRIPPASSQDVEAERSRQLAALEDAKARKEAAA
jgi:hypothetical protein